MMEVALILALGGAAFFGALALAYRGENRFLRTQLEQRRDHEQRMERVHVGLPEIKVDPPEADIPPPGVAIAIEDAIGAWDSAETQRQMRTDVTAWRREGKEWGWIVEQLREALEA